MVLSIYVLVFVCADICAYAYTVYRLSARRGEAWDARNKHEFLFVVLALALAISTWDLEEEGGRRGTHAVVSALADICVHAYTV